MDYRKYLSRLCSSPRSKFPWEIDHMFATQDLFNSLTNIKTIKVPQLSDHDPIIAEFDVK